MTLMKMRAKIAPVRMPRKTLRNIEARVGTSPFASGTTTSEIGFCSGSLTSPLPRLARASGRRAHPRVTVVADQRADIAMSDTEFREFLEAGRTAVLVTLSADGSPEPLGMWFLVEADGAVVMRTYSASQKAVNLRRDPRAALLVESGDRYAELRGVRLSGQVELVEDAEVIADIWTGLAVKYEGLAPEHAPAFRAVALARAGKQVGLRLRPTDVVSWDHRKLTS